jgi:transketolase
MPSQEVFAAQPASYRDKVLTRGVRRVAIEAGHSMSWHRWVGQDGRIISLDRFGASAPYQKLYDEFGFNTTGLIAAVRSLLG